MGEILSTNTTKDDELNMDVHLIGSSLLTFYLNITNLPNLSHLKKYISLKYLENDQLNTIINLYFDEIKKKENLWPARNNCVLIAKIKDLSVPEVDLILKGMDDIKEKIILLLLLENNSNEIKLQINSEQYPYIDSRLIFINKYTENIDEIQKEIEPKILRFFSIHNELGDIFTIDGKEYDLLDYHFPFYLNICCLGREYSGKSRCINEILQEYKSKEDGPRIGSLIKEKPFYYSSNLPIKILEISITYERCEYKYESRMIKFEDFNLVLFLLNFDYTRFNSNDIILLNDLIKFVKNKSLKIIFVFTNPHRRYFDVFEESKEETIRKFCQDLYHHNLKELIPYASKDNIIFINFKRTFDQKEFGKEILLEKIYKYFEQPKENNLSNKLSPTNMKNNALNLMLTSKLIIENNYKKIQQKEEDIANNEKKINELQQILNEKNKNIDILKEKIKQLEEQITKLLDNINQLKNSLEKEKKKFEEENKINDK